MADRIPWKLWLDNADHVAIDQEITARAQAEGNRKWQVRQDELAAALALVLAERGRLQRHRFGRKWLKYKQSGRRAYALRWEAQVSPRPPAFKAAEGSQEVQNSTTLASHR
ncbi:MAG: hypothetical protein HY329_11090 [Chloroflexi bacterium]|nr:hypothetical protein [Chloroflexota bacterium]